MLSRQRSVNDWRSHGLGKRDELKKGKCLNVPILFAPADCCGEMIIIVICDPVLQILEVSGGDLINPVHYWVTTAFATSCVHLISKLYSELFRAECRQMSLGRDFAGIENRLATHWCNLQNICRKYKCCTQPPKILLLNNQCNRWTGLGDFLGGVLCLDYRQDYANQRKRLLG